MSAVARWSAVAVLALAISVPAHAGKKQDAPATPLLEAMREYLVADDWGANRVPNDTLLTTTFRGDGGMWNVFVQTREEAEQVLVYSVLPSNVPEERRGEVAHFLTLANFGLYIGNFELDLRDGQVRYKTSIDVEGGKLTPKMIENLLTANMLTMNNYYAGLQKVAWGTTSAVDAIREIEGGK